MDNMLDYIFVDYLYYIISYSFFISIGAICACLVYHSFFGKNKLVSGIIIFSILFFLVGIVYPNFHPCGSGPHYNCNAKFEREAHNISSALANYFSEPSRTQIPSYSDLLNSEYEPLESYDLKRRDKLFKESEFSVDIQTDASEKITIVLSSKEEKCPFYRWKCPRRFKGKFYVLKMWDNGKWVDNYEDI